jgi:hypothetical protein
LQGRRIVIFREIRDPRDPRINPAKAPSRKSFEASDFRWDQSNAQNYESACPWDIYSLRFADEIV